MMSKTTTDLHLDHILFGNILGLTDAQVIETGCVALPVLLITLTKRRDLLLMGFDPAQARALGLHVRVGHYGLLILLSLAIVTALKAVGLILVVALLVTPGATAHLVTKRLDTMLLVSVASAVLATATGLWIAFAADASPGGCIVLVQGVLFLAAALGSRLSQGSELRG